MMLLVIDVGNTEVTTGLFRGGELVGRWRLTTGVERTPDEWAGALESFAIRAGFSPAEIGACCVGSVVANSAAISSTVGSADLRLAGSARVSS